MIDRTIVDELIENIAATDAERDQAESSLPTSLDENLIYFLSKCNGGYSKDNYFHFFGTSGNPANNIEIWNSKDLWRKFYGSLIEDLYFFAEDIFGNQVGYKNNGSREIFLFWVDDGRLEVFANSFEEFTDYTVFGFEVFRQMRELSEKFLNLQAQTLVPYKHLSYKIPILLGGNSGDINNLEIIDSIANLKFLGQLVTQTRALPKGTKIVDVIIDKEAQSIRLVPE